ncbi:MAG: RecQ family ATP-dependent DNA helicase, partial [bacterium]|nr:RecQ family ATP-dependent DNA helicase [bacterium]
MKSIAFIDLEVHPKNGAILDIGAINDSGSLFHSASLSEFMAYAKGTEFFCGHNAIIHDLKYLKNTPLKTVVTDWNIIDTLHLSALLFPWKHYHALTKDEKLNSEEFNNPLNDAKKARDLFYDEVLAFNGLNETLKKIFYSLLCYQKEFSVFFRYIGYATNSVDVEKLIKDYFLLRICEKADIGKLMKEQPISLAYALAIINTNDRFSITPPWILKSYPSVDWIMDLLRDHPCLESCGYCESFVDAHKGLKKFFGFDNYRTFGGEPLQEKAVKAALANKSFLAIFPTGGGKSIAFQVPALMSGENVKGLTVVISPLQSLMKDQVDNLELARITDAVTVSGLLDPIERAKSLERVEDGSASILYISPESLRSKVIEHLLLGRKIVRFVIDEAHCFSAWGHDFRVDYSYIGDFIKTLQEKKKLLEGIPVSCFTATAKPNVIEDIKAYFKTKLGLELEVFNSSASRTNLHYQVIQVRAEEEKFGVLRNLLQQRKCPTIVYVFRTKLAEILAEKLTQDGFPAKSYHGKMDKKEKSGNQDAFMAGEASIIVATSAFGMGVDKKDVGMVIHYGISNSLENYVQEAGR